MALSWDGNWDSHSLVNGCPSFCPGIVLLAPSPGGATRLDVSGTQEVYVSKMGIPRVDDWCVCMVQ